MDRRKIMLVDDNQELLRLLARLVEAEGWQPLAYPRGKPAIQAIATERPAAAVVDVLLPDVMGYDVAAALRQAGVPFVFMSGIFKGGRAASEARLAHGAAGYFEKPFEANRLLDAIRALLPTGLPTVRVPADPGTDFDVAVPVEPEGSVAPIDLTGRVEVNEAGTISAVIRGESLRAPGIPPPPPLPPLRPQPRARVGPADEGELRDNLPDLITAFWLTQQTGELALQRGRVKKALYFEAGRPCFAISNLVADRFGSFLVRVGKLTSSQLGLCQSVADRGQRKVSDVLVEMGVLREAEKIYYMAQQVKAIAYSLFAWEEGRYRVHFTGRASREATKVDIRPARLIARGVKKLYQPERLARLLGDEDLLVPTQQPAYPLHEVELEDWEAHLLPRVDGTRAVAELVTLSGRPAPQVRASLWSLVALEILEKYGG
jgi:two-component system OmpR family response regulator